MFAYAPINQVSVVIGGDAETIPLGQLVSGGYYDGLGVSAIAGRTLSPADDTPAAAPVAVISYRYWTSRFRRDPATIGRTIYVNNVAVTLIGVTPARIHGRDADRRVGGHHAAAVSARAAAARSGRGQGAAGTTGGFGSWVALHRG